MIIWNPIKIICQSTNYSSFTRPITVWSLQAEARTRVVTEPLVRTIWEILSLKYLTFDLFITPEFLISSSSKVDGIHSVERFVGDLFSPIFGGPVASGDKDKVRSGWISIIIQIFSKKKSSGVNSFKHFLRTRFLSVGPHSTVCKVINLYPKVALWVRDWAMRLAKLVDDLFMHRWMSAPHPWLCFYFELTKRNMIKWQII